MRVLIGYSMRSGSTLLLHILRQHSALRAYSDGSSLPMLAWMYARLPLATHVCIKPLDVFFNYGAVFRSLGRRFDKFVWIARDPRDSYVSSIETWIAYTFWRRGRQVDGVDTGLLDRWKRIYGRYFEQQSLWKLIRYEQLVEQPEQTVHELLDYLELSQEKLFPFPSPSLLHGGDFKVCQTNNVHGKSVGRYRDVLTDSQLAVFDDWVGEEMTALGYPMSNS